MQLIKKLIPRKNKKGYLESWGEFYCEFCKNYVEKRLNDGGKAKSCGCVQYKLMINSKIKHGMSNTRLYWIWGDMKRRCLNTNFWGFKDWGGRGITICNEWLEFIPFMEWSLSNGYANNLEIDRINNDGNYNPENCRWITHKINTQNRRNTKLNQEKANEIRELYNIRKYTQILLAKKYSISISVINSILNNKAWKI